MAGLRHLPNSFLALDPLEAGAGNKLPLWLFGFLYCQLRRELTFSPFGFNA